MNSRCPKLLAGALASSLLLACDPPGSAFDAPVIDSRPVTSEVARPLSPCVVPAPAGFVSLVATRSGVVFATTSTSLPVPSVRVERFQGAGCELAPDDTAPVAAESLLDADDLGNLFVLPAETSEPGVVSTMKPDEYVGDVVVKVDTAGHASKLLSAARGLWSFGVSPAGGSLWVTACGPTGIFTIPSDSSSELTPALASPETLWEQMPSALTADQTLWSVGVKTCAWNEPITPACGFALVRTTPEGSRELGATLVDFGRGFEQATLARCGSHVCGLFPGAVIVWGSEGEVLDTLTASDLDASANEHVSGVSGNQHGLYVSLSGATGTRVLFVPNRY